MNWNCENCPYLLTATGCGLIYINGTPYCKRELDGKTITVGSSTTGTGPITGFVGNGTEARE